MRGVVGGVLGFAVGILLARLGKADAVVVSLPLLATIKAAGGSSLAAAVGRWYLSVAQPVGFTAIATGVGYLAAVARDHAQNRYHIRVAIAVSGLVFMFGLVVLTIN